MNGLRRPLFNLEGEIIGEIELPEVFKTDIRPDIIRRVYLSQLTARIQPQGRDKRAGMRTSAESRGTGLDLARVPRIKGTLYPAAGRAAMAPFVRGGRRAHPPKVEKVIWERVNKKERRLAIMSAIAATASLDLIIARHRVDGIKAAPIIVIRDLEEVSKTKDLYDFLLKLGLKDELERTKARFRKIRSGKGKMRGRKRVRAKGPLIIYKENPSVFLAARNIPGVDVVNVKHLSIIHLAPGGVPGRLAIWSEPALKALDERFGG
ncbi:MAG: 50S ribosomal protein L4 [Thermoproteota archaeon]|mgnify:CR=1 FL=1|nr:MAG: 50S ribosomal protein L4 [Candidatus Korarchaeota archaeon]